MKLSLEKVERDGDDVVLRLIVFNDSTKPVEFDRRLLVGPNGLAEGSEPWPMSLEPAAKNEKQNSVLLNPYCFYGRERRFTVSAATSFYGYLVTKMGGLTPAGPSEKKHLVAAAEPLQLAPK